MLQISRIRLKNVRCFKDLDVMLPGALGGCILFVGDNATGKSALLKGIAMGLCDEAGAAGLLKESDEGYIRRGQTSAVITIDLRDDESSGTNFQIRTRIDRKPLGRNGIFRDKVRQTTKPSPDTFPWDKLFVSGYGAGRSVAGSGDVSSYSVIDAVYNLFNYFEGLQNPELTIRRLEAEGAKLEGSAILRVIEQFSKVEGVRLTTKGLLVDGPWGIDMPMRDLADGYRSAFTWIADLVGWALMFKPKLRGPLEVRGVVLIDEIEQHLHARWQRRAIADLRKVFPNVQFIASTHSPLIASSVGNPESPTETDSLFVLERDSEDDVSVYTHEFMNGLRMDQVLASRAFKFQVQADPEFERAVHHLSALVYDSDSPNQEEISQRIRDLMKEGFLLSTTPQGRNAEFEAIKHTLEELQKLELTLFGDTDDQD